LQQYDRSRRKGGFAKARKGATPGNRRLGDLVSKECGQGGSEVASSGGAGRDRRSFFDIARGGRTVSLSTLYIAHSRIGGVDSYD